MCNTVHTCPTPGVVHWASPWGRPQHWYAQGYVPPHKIRSFTAIVSFWNYVSHLWCGCQRSSWRTSRCSTPTRKTRCWATVTYDSFRRRGTWSTSTAKFTYVRRRFVCQINWHVTSSVFSQPSIYIDGWLYGMSMTSVVCNVPVLSQNDSTYHHSVFTTWKWHPFATWTPSFIILVWGHHPLIGATVFPASRTLVKRRTVTP